MELVLTVFDDMNEQRHKALVAGITFNLLNQSIYKIHCLKPSSVDVPCDIVNGHKLKLVDIDHNLTYHELFEYANDNIKYTTAGIVDYDVMLDYSTNWFELQKVLIDNPKIIVALGKHNNNGNSSFTAIRSAADDHRGLFFRTPVKLIDDKLFAIDLDVDTASSVVFDSLARSGYFPLNLSSRYRLFAADYRKRTRISDGNTIRLLPDFDLVKSVDSLIQSAGVDESVRYSVICEVLTSLAKLKDAAK